MQLDKICPQSPGIISWFRRSFLRTAAEWGWGTSRSTREWTGVLKLARACRISNTLRLAPSTPAQPRSAPIARAASWRLPGFASPLLFILVIALTSCSAKKESPAQRADAAKALFDHATKDFHLPSDTASGADRLRLQDQAAASYELLLKEYPEQDAWAAQALCGLANIRVAQTNLDESVKLFAEVAQKYPQRDWEILESWKSAADALWDARRTNDARAYYQKIVARYDSTNATQVVKTIVRGSQSRLAESAAASK